MSGTRLRPGESAWSQLSDSSPAARRRERTGAAKEERPPTSSAIGPPLTVATVATKFGGASSASERMLWPLNARSLAEEHGCSPERVRAAARHNYDTHFRPDRAEKLRRRSPYELFFDSKLDSVRESHPSAPSPTRAGIIGRMWKHMAPEERAVFEARCGDDRSDSTAALAAALVRSPLAQTAVACSIANMGVAHSSFAASEARRAARRAEQRRPPMRVALGVAATVGRAKSGKLGERGAAGFKKIARARNLLRGGGPNTADARAAAMKRLDPNDSGRIAIEGLLKWVASKELSCLNSVGCGAAAAHGAFRALAQATDDPPTTVDAAALALLSQKLAAYSDLVLLFLSMQSQAELKIDPGFALTFVQFEKFCTDLDLRLSAEQASRFFGRLVGGGASGAGEASTDATVLLLDVCDWLLAESVK